LDDERGGLYIPYGVKKEKEFFEGFPKREQRYAALGIAGSIVLSVAVFLFTRNLVQLVFMSLILIFGTIICTRRDDAGYSLVKQVQILRRFARAQKRYDYKYIFEWDDD
jgi:hypothetical protein